MADNPQSPNLPDPSAVTPGDTVDWIVSQRKAAQARALGAIDANPDDAARAMELSNASGANPAIVNGDLEGFEQQHKAALTSQILGQNSFLRDYVNSHPLAAQISNDDWGQLDTVSKKLQQFHGSNPFYAPERIGQSILEAAASGFKSGMEGAGPIGGWIDPKWGLLPLPRAELTAIGYPVELSSHIFSGIIEGARRGLAAGYQQFGGSPENANQFSNEMAGLIEAELMRTTGREGPLAPDIAEPFEAARPFLTEGVPPPVGVHPTLDNLHVDQSKLDLKALDEVFSEAQKSSTRERSPDLFANFIRSHTDSRIGIDAEAVRKLYGDKVPAPDDNLLGWVPGIQDQLGIAAASGGDIEVPLADWIAKADPEVAKELHDFIRVRPGGMTLEETKGEMAYPALAQEREKQPYENAPDSLMGFPKQGLTKPYEEQGYKFEQPVLVSIEGQAPFQDQVKGLNRAQALERAHRNWPGAKIEPIEGPIIPTVNALRQSAKLDKPLPNFLEENLPVLTGAPSKNDIGNIIVPEKITTGNPVKVNAVKVPSYASFSLADSIKTLPKDNPDPISKALTKLFSDKLIEHVGNTPVHIVSSSGMKKLADEIGWDFTPAGFYNSKGKYIAILREVAEGKYGQDEAIRTILHEGSHAFTQQAIIENPTIRAAIRAIQDEVKAKLTDENHPKLDYFNRHYLDHNEHEFAAGFHSDQDFQTALRHTEISDELRRSLHLSREIKSHWDAIREIIKRIWQYVAGEVPKDSALDAMLHISDVIERIRKGDESGLEEAHPTRQPELPQAGTTRMEDRDIFEKARAIGLTEKQYRRFQDLISKRAERDAEIQRQSAEQLERKRQTTEWKDNEKRVRGEVSTDLSGRPDIAADRFLREGDLYGEKYKRPKIDRSAVPAELRGRVPGDYLGDSGLHPDDVAGLFGYQSGDQLINALERLEDQRKLEGLTPKAHFSRLVDAETDRRMRAEYGNLEENILDQAKEHVVDQTQLDLLHEEVLALASQNNAEFSLTQDQIKRWVKDQFDATPLGTHASDKYLAAAGRAGAKAENALLEDDPAEAFRAKQQQYLSVLLAKEAVKLEKQKKVFDRLAKRFSKREVSGVPQEFTNWIHDILIRTGNMVRRSVQDLQEQIGRETHTTLEEFVGSKNHDARIWEDDDNMPSDFQVMPVAPFLFDPNYRKAIAEMTPAEFRAVHDSLKTLVKNGSDERKIIVGGEKADLAETIDKMTTQLDNLFGGAEKQYAFGHKDVGIGHTIRTYWASLLQIESIFNRFDRGDPSGIFKRAITEPIFEGSNGLATLEREFSRKYKEVPKFGDLKKNVPNHLFGDPMYEGETRPLNRGNLLAILQNVGNPQQLDKLARGYKIQDKAAIMQWLFQNTTKEDWDRAQALGNLFEDAFEESARMYHNLSGVAPEKIDLSPIQTPFGEYPGWYHPLIYDPIRPGTSKKLMGPNPLEDGAYFRVVTPSGYTKRRTGYAAPIQLNFDAIQWKLRQMLNDAAMRPAVTDAAKVFYNPKWQMAITKYYGKEIKDLMIPYLKDVAGQKVYKDAASSTALKVLDNARQNVIATLIGLNPGTVAKHGPTAAMLSIKEVGAASFLRELTGLLSMNDELGERNWDFAMNGGMVNGQQWNGSEELQRRQRNWQETLTGSQAEVFEQSTLRNAVIKFGATPVAISDLLSAIPTWLASYKEQIRLGETHGSAVETADRAVRRAHGSSAVAARPRIMRGGALAQLATPFYTFFNEMLQRQYEMAWRAKDALGQFNEGDYQAGLKEVPNLMKGMWAYVIFPALIEQLVSPTLTGNQSTTEKIAGWGLRTISSSFPGIRDIVEAFIGNRDPTIGLYSTSAKMLTDMGRDLGKGKLALSRQHAGATIKHAITAFGALSGLTNAQEGRTAQYVYNYATGIEHPRDIKDILRGLRTGTQKEFNR